ncbi:hypothetical protein Q5741_17720 [Paenibacillus sp. JX-17]|uniref:Uncharacterized protein n=1 Tax=Paenibacillus lacisoli TaxID=3064525 RepID=A0ABT9CI51_9BACL|nr:hypothetical protein [Paenibacillus sp. JX-17]MDO7908243.1 hypothetical protein [Paenibacillus sp. JX-17]
MSHPEELERKLHDLLTEGEMEQEDVKERQREELPPRYEIRIQTQLDPIAEETRRYRSIAKELDNRYDKYDSSQEPGEQHRSGPDSK